MENYMSAMQKLRYISHLQPFPVFTVTCMFQQRKEGLMIIIQELVLPVTRSAESL